MNLRLIAKFAIAVALLLMLLLFSSTDVDFVYKGF
jgi:hypothetical protein